jgi:hypothetical protein
MAPNHLRQFVAFDEEGTASRPGRSETVLIEDSCLPGRLHLQRASRLSGAMAALLGPRLDRRLASGRPPESAFLLAVRADRLASSAVRLALMRDWQHLCGRARLTPAGRSSRAPLCRHRIVGAEGTIRKLLGALSTPLPVSARGVAMASLLLSDGCGPLYNQNCATDLTAALCDVLAALDPASSLFRP